MGCAGDKNAIPERKPVGSMPGNVKDRVKNINAKSGENQSKPKKKAQVSTSNRIGNIIASIKRVRKAPAKAPKPAPSPPRQLGDTPSTCPPASTSPQSFPSASPREPFLQHSPRAAPTQAVSIAARWSPPCPRGASPQSSPAPASSRPDVQTHSSQASASALLGSAAQASGSPSTVAAIPESPLEKEAGAWIEIVTGENQGGQTLMQWLRSGQVLCRMANKIQPGICPRINTQTMPFKEMENVTAFIQACRKLGVMEKDVFSTVDLYEEKNPRAVVNCIHSLGGAVRRTAPSFRGPYIGIAQNANVVDAARAKTTVTQDSGYRTDVTHEVRAGVSKGRHM